MRKVALAAVAGSACLPGCGPARKELPPAGQLLLYVDTDAPLRTSDSGGPSLFDHVRIDGIAGTGPPCDCSQETDVTEAMFRARQISFGVLAPVPAGSKVRVRLYRIEDALDDAPPLDSTLDITFAIPALPSEGIAEYTLFLPTDEVGNPQGTSTPVLPTAGRPSPSRVGGWPKAARVDCPSPPGPGEVCVPGGAFWMGNRLAGERGLNSGDAERLVVLDPFYLDATEATVAQFRASGNAPEFAYLPPTDGSEQSYCTFTAAPGPFEDYPVNCMTWLTARNYCLSLGKDLPTEAQFEYVASALQSDLFVWGSDEPACADAILARGGIGAFSSAVGNCRDTAWGGAAAVASTQRDSLVLPSGTIHDLVGNVEESVLDRFALPTDPCWSRRGVYVNPLCGPIIEACAPPTFPNASYRGGAWDSDGSTAIAAYRGFAQCNTVTPERGVRCARKAR